MATTNLKSQSIGFIEIQSGNGVPNHTSALGSSYTDIDTGVKYQNTNGLSGWSLSSGGSSISGFTYDNNNSFILTDTSGNTYTATINTMSGLTISGGFSATTFSGNSIILSSSNGFKMDGPTTSGYILTTDANGNGTWQPPIGGTSSSRIAGSASTTTSGNTILSQISGLTANSTHLIETFVTAKSSGTTAWATYKKTLNVTTAGTAPTIRFTNSDFDYYSSNLSATTVNFVVSGTNININVSGVTNTDIQWNSAYEIVTKSTKV